MSGAGRRDILDHRLLSVQAANRLRRSCWDFHVRVAARNTQLDEDPSEILNGRRADSVNNRILWFVLFLFLFSISRPIKTQRR